MYPAMKNIEKIRVLVGLNVDNKTVQIIQQAENEQMSFEISHKEVKQEFTENIIEKMQNSEDSYRVERGVKTFNNWLQNGKLEMRIYPDAPIHAKSAGSVRLCYHRFQQFYQSWSEPTPHFIRHKEI